MNEPANFAQLLEERRASAKETLREASNEELQELLHELFPDPTHPWADTFASYIDQHRAERVVRGETSDGYGFVYFPQSERGIWYQHVGTLLGVGPLGERGLKALSEIVKGY